MRHGKSLLDNVTMLAVIGVLAGALGGLAIGVITNHSSAPAASSSASR